ncbi:MAG TPA: hypothetical protein VIY49_32810 [Bryobacteraceae bacterium]
MVFLKSILAGLVGVLAVVLLTVLGFAAWGWWVAHRLEQAQGGGTGAYAVNTPWIPVPIIAAVVFVAGFWWEFHRAKRA